MYCTNCGSKVEEDQKFCNTCGHSFESWDELSHPALQKSSSSKRYSPVWIYLIFITTLGLMVWGFYSAINGSNGLEQIGENQLQEIKKNQITKAYYEFSSTKFKEKTSLSAFRKFVDENPSLSEFQSVNFEETQKENNYGVAYGELHILDDVSIPIKYEFIKEDGEWRVLHLELDAPQIVTKSEDPVTNEVISAVKAQLRFIKEGNIKKAYEEYSSADFKDSADLELFNKFVQHYPYFSNYENIDLLTTDHEEGMAKVTAVLYADGSALPLEYTLKNEGGSWKVWSMQILKSPLSQSESTIHDKILHEPIQEFLESIRKGDLKKAYDLTSSKFQKTTTLKSFENFVSRFPIFRDSQETFIQNSLEKNVGQVRVELEDAKFSSTMDYTLIKEQNGWKILGIEILENAVPKPVKEQKIEKFNGEFLNQVVSNQLDNIKAKDLFSAYDEYSSSDFKKATPFENFARFIDQHKVFSENSSIEFKDLNFDNNIASLTSILTAKDGDKAVVEYDLVKEEGAWKILGVKIISHEKVIQEEDKDNVSFQPMQFEKLELGTKLTSEGNVSNPSKHIQTDHSDIFATLYINRAVAGAELQIILEHINSGSVLPPVQSILDKDGDVRLNLKFNAPKDGWPQGEYIIRVHSLPGNEDQLFPFTVIPERD
ncbi:MAG: DUF4864 domain-containing protein [Chlamydiota bacterium]|nr:DUF4864 domain-containing protein [Chlamydiota bacterium]